MKNQNLLALIAASLVLSLVRPGMAQSTISGRVTLEDETAVSGVKVWIYSAAPREGRGFL